MRSKMTITRIDSDVAFKSKDADVVDISYTKSDGTTETFRITPDFDGIRIHKRSIYDDFIILPACANEVIIK